MAFTISQNDGRDIGWGILGCGDVCEVKGGPNALNQPGSRVVHVMRRTAGRAEDFARRHDVPRWSDSVDAVLDDPAVDAVHIATPPGSHCELALRCAAAGKPLLVEKPMARSAAECKRMCAAFEAAGLPLWVAYYRRCLPRWVRVKQLIDDGELGTLTHVDYRMTRRHRPQRQTEWRMQAEQSGGGLILDLGSHLLDLLDHLLGPLDNVAGDARNHSDNAVEDSVCMSFLARDCLGTATWNFAGSVMEDVLTLTGTQGRITVSCFGTEPFSLQHGDKARLIAEPTPSAVQRPLTTTIVHDLRTGEQTCPSTGRSALRTNAVIDAVLDRFYAGRSDSFWERLNRVAEQRS
ncbi:MAG: Gfo/Idh/MocA family oxidoreductase [Planctomycetota bacterium]